MPLDILGKRYYNVRMARKAREYAQSGSYHVVLRGNDKLLFVEEADYRKFLELAGRAFEKDFAALAAYYIESEAVHLVLREGLSGLSALMKEVVSLYAQWCNDKYNRSGKLFRDRFASEPLESDEEFLDCVRFVHRLALERQNDLNYKYSSYGNYLRRSGLMSDEVMLLLGQSPLQYRVYMDEPVSGTYLSDKAKDVITDAQLAQKIRELLDGVTPEELEQLEPEQLKLLVRRFKKIDGASIRKLARVIGVSKSFVEKC